MLLKLTGLVMILVIFILANRMDNRLLEEVVDDLAE